MGIRGWLAAMAVALAGWTGAPAPVLAQNLFETVTTVNGIGINRYQIAQRARFLALLGAPNAGEDAAREALIDETLQTQAARAAGVEVTADQLDAGLVEFAARGNLEPDQFLQVLERGGVAPETFRDFVRNGLYWRTLVQTRFGPQSRPTEAEVERAVAQGDNSAGIRVLLSEIALPITPENREEVLALADQLSRTLRGQEAFQRAARTYSRSPSARRGGRLDFVSLGQLAPPIAAQILTLSPGEVTEPINLGPFVGIYLLRALDESAVAAPETLAIDYAEVAIPGGRTQAGLARAARLDQETDVCDDLYGTAAGLNLSRQTLPVGQLPADLRQALAVLDDDESTTLLGGSALRYVMLCGRVADVPEGALDQIGQQILNQRLGSYADNFLAELRADAIITGS